VIASPLTPPAPTRRPLVLVIDDDPAILKLLGRYLDRLDLEVATAHDGQAGLDFLRENDVALVCVDLMLPTKSGFAVCETIRHAWKWDHFPLLVISCRSTIEARAQAEVAGANAYLVKPFGRTAFEQQVRRLLKLETRGT
jgi:two-component system alkaline phosphatase synthesis response regulator PhoP